MNKRYIMFYIFLFLSCCLIIMSINQYINLRPRDHQSIGILYAEIENIYFAVLGLFFLGLSILSKPSKS